MVWPGLQSWTQVVWDYLASGGLVMAPLVVVSVWLWALIILKLAELHSFSRSDDKKGWPEDLARELRAGMGNGSGSERRNQIILESLLLKGSARLERYVGTILVLAAVAPLLGLLGTVTGMISTFQVIAVHGTGNAKALAGGISEALVTTQSGLVVALPGLFMGNFIRRRVERTKAGMERFGLGLIKETGQGRTPDRAGEV